MYKRTRNGFSLLLAAIMFISAVSGIALALPLNETSDYEIKLMDNVSVQAQTVGEKNCIDTEEKSSYADDEKVTFIIEFEDEPLLETSGTVKTTESGMRILTEKGINLRNSMLEKQNAAVSKISSACENGAEIKLLYNYSAAFNGVAIEAPYGLLDTIKNTDGVKNAHVSPVFDAPKTESKELNPQMATAGDMMGASAAWDSGYDGEGTLIAIIDTGLYTDHEAFQTAPEKLKYSKSDIQNILNENQLQAEKRVSDISADSVYLRDKIPFAFDYANGDCDVNHGREAASNDHGTHVAGIAAADAQKNVDLEGAENMCVKGAAPKAQLAIMKVFGDNGGGAQWANIVAAMEDTIYLGADSVNISIGEVYSFPTLDETYAKMFDLMHENGINVSVSAGNYYNSAYASTWGTGMNTTLNLENSMLTSPSIYRENLCVASVNNTSAYCTDYISVNGYQMTYCDSALDVGGRADLLFNKAFGGQTLEYVVIDGYGEPKDYENIDINGKIALVQRGGIIFPEKQLNAYNAGAAGFILYDNVVQPPLIQMNIADPLIPSIAIRRLSGLKMVEEAENGVGKVYIAPGNPTVTEAGDGYEPSDFSSWGPLSDLTIKPEISAPGGNIISTVDYYLGGNNKANYASYSGTSMAAPGATGCMAVIRQRVNELFPNMTPKEKANVVYALAMSTAVPSEHDGTPYGVRKQGAGVINAANAVKTNAYITVDGQDHPKIELGDDASRSGVYKLSFNVVNFGNTKLEYDIEPILTVPGYSYVDQGYRATYVQTDYNKNCTDMMSFTSNMPNNRVTVEAGQTVNVEVTMSVNDEFRELMSDVFKYGSYVEGYCRLNAVGTGEGELYPNLSVCYLGYYGSWCECPVVDSGFYYDEPQNDLSCMTSPNTAGSKINMLSYMELGMNPYFEDDESFSFLADRCSISPANEDGMYDAVDYFLTGIVRNLSKFYYRIYDPQTNEVYFEKVTEGDFPKNDDRLATGSLNPMGTSTNKLKTWRGENQAEGQTLMIRCGGEGLGVEWDEAKAPMSHWEIPVTVDNTAPYIVESHSEGTKLFVTVSDAHYAAYAGVFENEDDENPFAAFCISENERGAKTTVEIDMQGREKAYLLLGDYACNEAQYEIKHTSGGESPLPSDSVEPIPSDAPVIDGVYYQQAAQLTDGEVYIIAATDNGYHALTTNSTPNGIAGAKTNVTIEQGVNVISGFATNAIEWKYESGKLVNVQTGEKLEVGDDGILKLTDVGTQWTYSGTKLISGNYAMAYNGWFDANSDGSVINIFRKVANIKDAQAIMGVNIRRAGNKLFADITFETEQPVTSGVITSSYDSDMLTLTDVHNGDMMNGVLVQVNSQLNDKVLITYAGADTFEADGSIMFSVEFELKETAVAGTVLLFELAANETILDDTTTMIKVDVSGAVYTVEGEVEPSAVPTGSPTVTPTNPEPTDSPTSTPTVTATLTPTAEPTYIPTDTPTNVPTEQPTVTPTQTVTVAPTTAPTSMPTANPTVAPTPMVPPETGDRMGLASLCFAIFGLSAISYTVVRRREYADDEQ